MSEDESGKFADLINQSMIEEEIHAKMDQNLHISGGATSTAVQ